MPEHIERLIRAGVVNPAIERLVHDGKPVWGIYDGTRHLGMGGSLREALANAGHPLPVVSEYAAIRLRVVLGDETVATARSVTMARRIANALNAYTPSPSGR